MSADRYLFGAAPGTFYRGTVQKIDAVARRHGVSFTQAEGRHWFSADWITLREQRQAEFYLDVWAALSPAERSRWAHAKHTGRKA